MSIEYTTSQRGAKLLILDGFIYTKHSENDDGVRWRCTLRSCRGSLLLNKHDEIASQTEHNHDSDQQKIDLLRIKNQIKNRAVNTKEKVSDIMMQTIKNKPVEIIKDLPKISSIRDNIVRMRRSLYNFIPESAHDIPEELRFDFSGKRFFRWDSGIDDPSRFIVFASEFKEKFIGNTDIWLIDGTFNLSPHGFCQILTIHAYFLGRTYPLIYVFLSNKTELLYTRVFEKINILFSPKPKYIITDFEKAIINSIKKIFHGAESYLCMFHFGQSIWRWIQSKNLSLKYKNDLKFKLAIQYFLNLAFVPLQFIDHYYNYIIQWILNEKIENLKEFINYFKKIYFGNEETSKESIFNKKSWNVYDRVLNNIPRTTNAVEGWHRSFNAKNEIAHPNIARLVTKIKEEEEFNRISIIKALCGNFELTRKNLKKEEFLRTALENFNFFSEFEFLNVICSIKVWSFDEDSND